MTEMTARQRLIREIQLRLGGGMVDIELDPEHYDFAVTAALDRYRQRSQNAIEESFVFLDVQPDVATYTLPQEVQIVRAIYRRNAGSVAGATVDPFSLAFTNNIYLIQNPGQLGGTGAGMLATYDFAMQYQELIGRMFGRDIMFTWDPATKKLTLHRRIAAVEQVLLHCYNDRPEEILLNDPYSKPWLRDYSIAMSKLMLGEARSKFASLAGPQGGVTLNGDAMKSEAQTELERLETELQQLIDGTDGMPFIIG